MNKILKPDICVIGAGSGGLSVAAAAAAFDVEVVLIEKDKMGGDCLNYGCVPSKAIIAAGKTAKNIQDAEKFGVIADNPKIDWQKVHDHIHNTINAIAPMDSQERFESMGVKVIREAAKFKNKNTVEAGHYTIQARRFVIATGSHAFVPPIKGIDNVPYFTNETIFDRNSSPKHLIIIGGGPIGMEMAQAHKRLGADVSVIEGLKVLGKEDRELAQVVVEKMKDEGIKIFEDSNVVEIEKFKDKVSVKIENLNDTQTIEGDTLFIATGRKANISELNLDAANVKTTKVGIKVNEKMRTSNRRIYAIGDVAGGLQFTHAAAYHAGLVIRGILFRIPAKENLRIIPWCSYTDPEIAHVGYTVEQAQEKFGEKKIKILKWEYNENDRAQAERKTNGLIKISTLKNGKILGASIVGASAGEMIHIWALAVAKNMKVSDIAGYVAPYPTLSEIGKRAATSFYIPATKNPKIRKIIKFLRMFG